MAIRSYFECECGITTTVFRDEDYNTCDGDNGCGRESKRVGFDCDHDNFKCLDCGERVEK